MSKSLNKWEGIGNLCADPDARFMPNGDAVSNINLACNDSYKKKDSGETVDTTQFIKIVFFRGLAKVVADYLEKGSKIYVSGKLTIRKYQDSSGADKWATEIVADNMIMLDTKRSSDRTPPASSTTSQTDDEDYDDKIPF